MKLLLLLLLLASTALFGCTQRADTRPLLCKEVNNQTVCKHASYAWVGRDCAKDPKGEVACSVYSKTGNTTDLEVLLANKTGDSVLNCTMLSNIVAPPSCQVVNETVKCTITPECEQTNQLVWD